MVVFWQIGCIRAKWLYTGKVVVFWQNLLYSGKKGCIRAKLVVFGQMLLYSGKLVVFAQTGFIQARWLYLGKSGCYREKVVVFGIKVVVLR